MDRRKKILVNPMEIATHQALREAVERCNAMVYAKVGVGDALDIWKSGLTDEEFAYATKAHFDFVVARGDETSAFAVEFDGRQHNVNPRVVYRDSLKNSICEKLGMPLLRVDANYLKRVGRFSLLGWLVEVWFLDEGFGEAQARGEVPFDEPFSPTAIIGLCYVENGKFVEVSAEDLGKAAVEMNPRDFAAFQSKLRTFTPYDPFIGHRAQLQLWSRKGICEYPPQVLHGRDPQGYQVAVALVSLGEGDVIIGVGRLKPFRFPPVSPRELAEDLAVMEAAEKLGSHLKGRPKASKPSEVARWREQVGRWRGYM